MNRNMKKFLSAAEMAIGTALYFAEHSDKTRRKVKNFLGDQIDDVRDRAKDTYDVTVERASDLSDSLRGRQRNGGWHVLRFMVGLGIGIGVGLLIAPASGEDTRAKLSEKAQEIGDRARQRFNSSDYAATGSGD